VRNHGTGYGDVLARALADAADAARIEGTDTLMAEVTHAVRSEMAVKLEDVVLRRTDLGSGCHPGTAAVRAVAERMRTLLGWDESRLRDEIAGTEAALARHGAAMAAAE
jgi:glycerol-3-phosphate dehydrogenase